MSRHIEEQLHKWKRNEENTKSLARFRKESGKIRKEFLGKYYWVELILLLSAILAFVSLYFCGQRIEVILILMFLAFLCVFFCIRIENKFPPENNDQLNELKKEYSKNSLDSFINFIEVNEEGFKEISIKNKLEIISSMIVEIKSIILYKEWKFSNSVSYFMTILVFMLSVFLNLHVNSEIVEFISRNYLFEIIFFVSILCFFCMVNTLIRLLGVFRELKWYAHSRFLDLLERYKRKLLVNEENESL